MIKDSGERREFDSGAVRDIQEGKGRCDLLPLDVIAKLYNIPVFVYICEFQRTGDYNNLRFALNDFAYHQYDNNRYTMLLELAKHFEDGAKKYGEYNWQKGIPTRCYIDSAVRHYLKFEAGWDDEPHERAFIWNLVCCIWTCINKPELNDYAKGKDNE